MESNISTYCCIDLKSYYASVECVDRGLDPFKAPLVVADPDRGNGTICLAVSPALKALGVSGRPRIYQIPDYIDYIVAPPRMELYMERSAEIVSIYLEHICADDLHVYSIDECFIDLTPYSRLYSDPVDLALTLKNSVFDATGIYATVGIGANLYQAKVALDILAKHEPMGVAILNDETFRERIWHHRPLTDLWGIGRGISRRLGEHGIYDLEGITRASVASLYKEFGVNAEYLIDHAWGIEPCTIQEIHNYIPKEHSISSGQVLMRDYKFDEARLVVREEVEEAVLDLVRAQMLTNCVSLFVGYSKEAILKTFALHTGGSKKLDAYTDSFSKLAAEIDSLFVDRVDPQLPITRLGVAFSGLMPIYMAQLGLFDVAHQEEERTTNMAINTVLEKFGRGSLMRGTSYMPGATGRERAHLIGGHRAR